MKITFKHEIKPEDNLSEQKLTDILLKNRKIKDYEEFLNPLHPVKISLTDFGFKRELAKSLKLLKRLKNSNEMIVIYTDYDADGITGGAILWETLHLMGFNVMPFVPHRKLEGYGFSFKGIDNVKKKFNPSLIISVDHGITARDKVAYSKKNGIPIIITDHHLKPDQTPEDAEAIFHIPQLSGSGVAYFFAKEIFKHFSSLTTNYQLLTTNFQTDYLSLASIGSIADLVPLTGPTRSLVKYGLEALSRTKRIGLKHIIKEAGIEGRTITPYEVGFVIAPRINALGRLEHAIDALRLLCTTNEGRALRLAQHVGGKNRERQDLVTKAVEEAKKTVETRHASSLPKIIILENKNWHEGIIGLIAAKISDEFYRPTIVLTESDGFLKGSARSIPSFHITNFLRDQKKNLIDVGGHRQAAGFTMEKTKFTTFATTASRVVNKYIKDEDLEKTIEADVKIPLSMLNLKLVKSLEPLQPFGIGNPKPTFYSEVELADAKIIGKKNDHLKLYVKESDQHKQTIEMLAFNSANLFTSLSRGQKINIVYTLDIDRWNAREKMSGKIVNIV